ncbi:MAG TPA: hypothetical protein DCP28_34065, partial [Cytophagales bacterium]|nr:hypothetical protein [Cytophagales bacterium]
GALTLEQAVDVIYNRSKEQDRASGAGVMLAVGQTLADAMKEIRGVEDRVSIAAINGPEMLTLAGDKEPIEEIAKRLEEKEVFNKFLRVSVPFHSHHMEPLKEDLLAGLAHLEPGEAKTPLYSTVTGQEEDGLHLTSDYWYSNVRDTVYFTAAIEEMINDGYNVFVEIAPHPVLGASVNDMLGSMNKQGTIITSARRDIKKFEGGVKYEESTFLRGASQLAITGAKVDWTVLYQGSDAKYVKLPRYVWQHQEFWSETKEHRKWRTEVDAHPLVENFQFGADSAVNTFNLRPDKRVEKWLVDHVIDDVLVVPGTGQVEMANTVGKMKYGEDFNFVEDLNFDQALTLPDDGPSPYVRLRFISQEEGEYVIESADREDDELVWKQHSSGKMNFLGDSFESRTADLEVIRQRCTEAVDVTAMYQDVASYGLKYGPTFRLVQDMNLGGDAEILSTVKLHDSLGYGADRFAFHPALLDASLHTIFGQRKSYNGKKGNYLPAHIDRVKVYQKPDAEVLVYVKMTRNDADFLNGDYIIMNLDGTVVAEIQGLVCKYVKGSRGESLDSDYEGVAEYVWQAASIDELLEGKDAGEPKVGNVLVLADGTGVGEHMINALKGKVDNLFVARKGDAYAENTVDGVKEFTLPLSKYSDKLDLQEAGDDKSPEKLQPEYEQELALYSQMIQAAGANSIDKIVYLWGLDNTVNDDTDSETFTRQSQDLFFGAVNTIKALTTANEDYTGQFWFVTQGLERVTHAEEQINFGQGGMYGIMRVLVNEYPSIAVRAVDLENHAGAEQLDLLVSEVTTYGEVLKNVEVALRGTDRYQRVATQVTAEDAEDRAARKMNAAGAWFHADVKTIGDAESIVFREKVQADLGAGEVLVEVKAAGVSKVDVDIVMSPESEEEASFGYTGNRLGREAAGVVKAVGEGVSALAVGDEVYGWVNEGVAGMATALERTLAKKPAHISFEEAATITVPFMTAHYALGSLAQLDEGERILIHNANTGIGVAAIHFAQKLGAEIFATAKTEEQRQYVRDLGVEHVFDSDSGKSEFYKGILKAIGSTEEEKKRGVIDVVLNSLSGKATTQSMRLLRDFGRFIELSKEDINDNRQLSLANFGRNLAYFAMDMDRLVKNKPRVATRIFQEVVALFENKTVTPVSPKVFSVGDTQEAIKFLADGENIGKVALSIDGELSLLPMKELRLMKNGSYLISGGMGGLGLTLARNFAGLGAGTVVLLSRSGRAKTDRDKRLIQEMEDMGTKVLMPTGDVADYARIQEVIAELKDEAPLRGVVHSAALMKDSTFGNMGPGTYYKAFQAKALGAFNLHKAVKDIDTVDFFMPISSISAFVGLPGQSNYSAANNFEDKLSLHRQVLGLRGSAIQYGVLSGEIAGLSREVGEETVLKVLEQQGWDIMPENRIVNHANRLILDQAPFRMHADMHWGQFGEFFAHLQKDSRFEEVLKNAKQGSGGEGGGSLLDQLKNLDEDGRNAKLQEEAQGALAKILGTSADKIDIDKSISKIGLDSLMLNQLRNWIQGKLEINFPLMKIAKGPTIIELAEEILKIVELDTAAGAGDSGAAKDAKPAVKEIPTMTENGVTFEAKDGLWISKDNWLARAEGVNDNASLQMFCMHGMGGESEMFFPFMLSSPKDTKVFTMQQPGRGHGSGATMDRSGEPQYAKSEQLLEKMMEVLLPWLNKPTIFWGHSMGGMELWEISRRLKANHPEAYANVKGLVISGTASPIALDNWKTKRMLVDSLNLPVDASEERLDELVEHFRAMMPELQSATFLKRVIQVMGRDMRMWHDFEPDPNRVPLDLPLLALASTEDGVTPFEEEFLPWKQEVEEGKFDLVEFLGDHWFLTTRVKKKEADGSFATDEKGNTIELANNEEIVKENIQRFINQWVG